MKRTSLIQQGLPSFIAEGLRTSRTPITHRVTQAAKFIESPKAFLWLLLLSATACSVAAANPNLVANNSFQSGSLGSWSVSGSPNIEGSLYQTADPGDIFVVELHDTGSGIYQNIATQSGKSYTLRFAYAGEPCGPADKYFSVYWEGNEIASLEFDVTGRSIFSMGWQYYEVEVTASGSSSELRFESTTDDTCGPVLDGISVKEVVHTVKLATTGSAGSGWTFYPFLNGGGSQQYYTTGSTIDTTGLQNPAPQAVYQKLQPEFSTLTVNDLSPTKTYRVRVHLSSIPFSGSANVSQNVWVSNGGSPNTAYNVNPYASGNYKATIVDLGQIYPSYPGYSGQLFIGITPSAPGKGVVVNGVEIFKDP